MVENHCVSVCVVEGGGVRGIMGDLKETKGVNLVFTPRRVGTRYLFIWELIVKKSLIYGWLPNEMKLDFILFYDELVLDWWVGYFEGGIVDYSTRKEDIEQVLSHMLPKIF